MDVSLQQAVANAIGSYLQDRLPGVTVSAFWPEANVPLPERAVTVILAGAPAYEDVNGSFIRVVSEEDTVPPDPAGIAKLYTWQVNALRQKLQLDIWAVSDVERDDICKRLDEELHRGLGVTLGTGGSDPFRDGILLALGDGYDGFVDFTPEGPPDRDNAPDAQARQEFRATLMGEAACVLTLKAESPRLLRGKLRMFLGEQKPATTDTFTISATTFQASDP